MITSKKDLIDYLEADKKALNGPTGGKPSFTDFVWKFEISLRKNEYYINCKKSVLWLPLKIYHRLNFGILSIICGYSIPLNCIGKGLAISHRGTIVISHGASIGENCRLHVCVNIGTVPGCGKIAPKIGDNVYIGPGAKLYGNIEIASGIMIGANAVVTKSFIESNICIAGVPARKISDKGRFEIEKQNRIKYGG